MAWGEIDGGTGVRPLLNSKSGLTILLACAVIAAGGTLIYRQLFPSLPASQASRDYFSDDDGQTYFAADATSIPPITHNGRPAYRCRVFRCVNGGQPFVNHLEKFDDGTKQRLEQDRAKAGRVTGVDILTLQTKVLVKRPGESEWVSGTDPARSQEFREIITPTSKDCPANQIEAVMPK